MCVLCMRMCRSTHGKCAHTETQIVCWSFGCSILFGRLFIITLIYSWNTFAAHAQSVQRVVSENVAVVVAGAAAAMFEAVITGRCQSCVKAKAHTDTTNNFVV